MFNLIDELPPMLFGNPLSECTLELISKLLSEATYHFELSSAMFRDCLIEDDSQVLDAFSDRLT